MTIYVFRHAESEGNTNPFKIGQKGNTNLKITKKGKAQARALGEYLWPTLASEMEEAPTLWTSPMKRLKKTWAHVVSVKPDSIFAGQEIKLFENTNLAEKSFGILPYLLNPADHPGLKDVKNKKRLKRQIELVQTFTKHMHGQQEFLTEPPFGESDLAVCNRVSHFIDTMRRDILPGKRNHVIGTHGGVGKALIKEFKHLSMDDWDKIPSLGNCDLVRIELTADNRIGSVTKIWDGELMKEDNTDLVAGLTPFSINKLPSVRVSPNGS